ncbi:uncharacterized protein F5891DRAFT_1063746 [Suillus fuscotomentosus]|uniref:Spt6 acidic N-terminal domain-containing protein n=1 Tax=Suillus fuscotomentosus TaxID=1912939 RepID=A0AAD4DUF9_9AGAM|nr:uncharacterized protein F5891DRAFT_1063670 [Suillus fuscotomentosus]XP_041219638.1 uncharacterized protein F5891DRAFT_1063746 [Suillus fuscotomentosus]KAG1894050.1 hypothetical protein F5891DRAFT_1063670 [Suillus fuscotomentosus]KAG1894062.1 hypothetical protein F5891DRAFT_1063746 [Suillus fuscotomentosus]
MADPQVISDDSSEEVEEEARRIRERFIVDENEDEEEDDDDDEARHRGRKRRKRRHRRRNEEALEEDDLELLERWSPPAPSTSKRQPVVESSEDELDNEDRPPVQDIKRIWDDERAGGGRGRFQRRRWRYGRAGT